MKNIMRILRRGGLLTKRLYKKLTFILLLAMIPLLIVGYGLAAREESGIVTVALASRGETIDHITEQVMDELRESRIILFVKCNSAAEAEQMVLDGEANAAWIFDEDLEKKIYNFAAKRTKRNAFVTIIEPEDSMALTMVREMLSGALFSNCSEAVYLQYVREEIPELSDISDEQLLEYYYGISHTDGLFEFTDIEGNIIEESRSGQTYLTAPVRGMLAVVIALSGMAAAMYFIKDSETGTFSWVSQKDRIWVELGCQLICLINVTAAVILALALNGQTEGVGRELLTALLYVFCVGAFSMLLRRITLSMKGLAMAAPLLVVIMLVVCPVFIDMGRWRALQYLFPPTYFINGLYNDNALIYMALYTLAALLGCRVIDRIKKQA